MANVKNIKIKNASGGYDSRKIGADAIDIDVQYDASGVIITDSVTQTADPTKEKSLSEVLKATDKATSTTLGTVKLPIDGTITMDPDGTIHGGAARVSITKISYNDWAAKQAAGELEEGILYDTYDEYGPGHAIDTILSSTSGNPISNAAVTNGKANKYEVEADGSLPSFTLLASGWTGTEAPYTYDLNISIDYDIELLPPSNITVEMNEAIVAAQIISNGENNIIYAYGDKPEIDIPIKIKKTAR